VWPDSAQVFGSLPGLLAGEASARVSVATTPVADTEQRVGVALTQLIESGLSVTDAVGWCGHLTEKEARRLMRRATAADSKGGGDVPGLAR
jgi:hypothetical protein